MDDDLARAIDAPGFDELPFTEQVAILFTLIDAKPTLALTDACDRWCRKHASELVALVKGGEFHKLFTETVRR